MNLWLIVGPLGFIAIVAAVFREIHKAESDPVYQAHKRQQKALRDHHRTQELERKRAQRWWKARGKVIRPGREEA